AGDRLGNERREEAADVEVGVFPTFAGHARLARAFLFPGLFPPARAKPSTLDDKIGPTPTRSGHRCPGSTAALARLWGPHQGQRLGGKSRYDNRLPADRLQNCPGWHGLCLSTRLESGVARPGWG